MTVLFSLFLMDGAYGRTLVSFRQSHKQLVIVHNELKSESFSNRRTVTKCVEKREGKGIDDLRGWKKHESQSKCRGRRGGNKAIFIFSLNKLKVKHKVIIFMIFLRSSGIWRTKKPLRTH